MRKNRKRSFPKVLEEGAAFTNTDVNVHVGGFGGGFILGLLSALLLFLWLRQNRQA